MKQRNENIVFWLFIAYVFFLIWAVSCSNKSNPAGPVEITPRPVTAAVGGQNIVLERIE